MKDVNPIYEILLRNLPDFWRYHYNDHYSDFFIREKLFGKGGSVDVPEDIECFHDSELMKANMVHNYLTHTGINASAKESLSSKDKGMLHMLSQSPDFYLSYFYGSTGQAFFPSFITYFLNGPSDFNFPEMVNDTDIAIEKLTAINPTQYDAAWWSNGMKGLKYFYPFIPICRQYIPGHLHNTMLYRNDPAVPVEGSVGIITGDSVYSKIPIIAHANPAYAISKAINMGCVGVNTAIPDEWYPGIWPNSTQGQGVDGPDKFGYPVILFVINDPLSLAHNGARFSSLDAGQIYMSSKTRYRVNSIGCLDWYKDPLKTLTQGVTVVEVTIENVSGRVAKDMYKVAY